MLDRHAFPTSDRYYGIVSVNLVHDHGCGYVRKLELTFGAQADAPGRDRVHQIVAF